MSLYVLLKEIGAFGSRNQNVESEEFVENKQNQLKPLTASHLSASLINNNYYADLNYFKRLSFIIRINIDNKELWTLANFV